MLGGVYRLNSRASALPLIFTIASITLVYWRSIKVCISGCVWRMHLEQIFGCSSPSRKCIGTMLWDDHRSNCRAAASPLIFNRFTIAAIALVYWRSKKVCRSRFVRRTHLEQIFGISSPSRKCIGTMLGGIYRSNRQAAASPLIFKIYYSCHRTSILEYHKGVYMYSPFRKCIGTMLGGIHCSNRRAASSPFILYRITISAIALAYWRGKKVCSSGCVRRTHFVQIIVNSLSLRKYISNVLGGVHRSNSQAASSPLILYRSTIAALALVYWRGKKVCSYGCVSRTHLDQIFVSCSPPRKCIGTMFGGVHCSNIRAAASTLIFNC